MAKKRTLDRRTLRDQSDAAEARSKGEMDEKIVKDDDLDEEEPEEEEDAADDDDGGDEDEDGVKKKKKKPKAKAKPKAKKDAVKKPAAKRTRTPKEVRMRAVWVVFDNSSKRVNTFPYSEKKEAEELLAKKMEEKPNFYMQLVKEPLVEA